MNIIDPRRPAYLRLSHRHSYYPEQCDRHADSCSVLLERTLHISSRCCMFQIFRSDGIEPVDLNPTVRVSERCRVVDGTANGFLPVKCLQCRQ